MTRLSGVFGGGSSSKGLGSEEGSLEGEFLDPMGWMPSYKVLASAFGVDIRSVGDRYVKLRGSALLLLLGMAIKSSSFDEKFYMQENSDIRTAFDEGRLDDIRKHYTETGYFEGREPGKLWVDEVWYQTYYSDVGVAIKAGKVASASEHYYSRGVDEWRAPNPSMLPIVLMWRDALAEG